MSPSLPANPVLGISILAIYSKYPAFFSAFLLFFPNDSLMNVSKKFPNWQFSVVSFSLNYNENSLNVHFLSSNEFPFSLPQLSQWLKDKKTIPEDFHSDSRNKNFPEKFSFPLQFTKRRFKSIPFFSQEKLSTSDYDFLWTWIRTSHSFRRFTLWNWIALKKMRFVLF